MDFAKLIAFQAATAPHRPAVAFTGGVATYGVLAGAASVASGRIRALALPHGAIAAIDVRNPFHHTVLLVALALEGIASVSVQTASAIAEAGLAVDVLLADPQSTPAPGIRVAAVDGGWFDHDPQQPPAPAALLSAPGTTGDQVLRVVLSSGTTGRPKAVAITARVLAQRFANASFTFNGGSMAGARAMSLMGFSTLPAFMTTFGTLAGGGLVCHAPHPRDALHLIGMFQVAVLALTPHQLGALVAAQGSAPPPPSLHTLVIGGSRTPRDLLAQARAHLCANVLVGYGTTEAGSIAHAHASAVEDREGAAGPLLPWVEVQVVDDAGAELPRGREGALRVRSNEMAAYVRGSLADLEDLSSDWFEPGDVGMIDADGMLFITGRTSEIINRGGAIVAPDLVESVLRNAPRVADAACFGMPNSAGIEEIWAAVVAGEGFDIEAVKRAARGALADKAPDRILVVDAIPRNDMGKVLRRVLVERARTE